MTGSSRPEKTTGPASSTAACRGAAVQTCRSQQAADRADCAKYQAAPRASEAECETEKSEEEENLKPSHRNHK